MDVDELTEVTGGGVDRAALIRRIAAGRRGTVGSRPALGEGGDGSPGRGRPRAVAATTRATRSGSSRSSTT